MLVSRITKTWSAGCDKWHYCQTVAYINEDSDIECVPFWGWSVEEVEGKVAKLKEALDAEKTEGEEQ